MADAGRGAERPVDAKKQKKKKKMMAKKAK